MPKELSEAAKQELDDALLHYLSACEEYVRLQLALDKNTRGGRFKMMKARQGMGRLSITSLHYKAVTDASFRVEQST